MKSWKLVEKRLAERLNTKRNGNLGIATSDFDALGISFEVKQRTSWPSWFVTPLYQHTPDCIVHFEFQDTKRIVCAFDFSAIENNQFVNDTVSVEVKREPKWLGGILSQAKANTKEDHLPVAVVHKKYAKRYMALCEQPVYDALQAKLHEQSGGEICRQGAQEKMRGGNVAL